MLSQADKSAITKTWVALEPTLLARLERVFGASKVSEDICQQVAVALVEHFAQLRHFAQAQQLAWAWRRARWLSLNWLDSKHYRYEDLTESPGGPQPEGAVLHLEFWQHLFVLLDGRAAAVARLKLEGYTATEIGKKLNIEAATARSHWRHAKEKLQEALNRVDYE